MFVGQKSVFRRYCISNVKYGIQIQVYNVINESVYHSSQFISVKDKKNLSKYQAQFREKLRILRLRQNDDIPIKKFTSRLYFITSARGSELGYRCGRRG